MLFVVVGTLLSISGFISGIIVGGNTRNFGFCLLVWLGTFLYAIIYFGIGMVITKLGELDQKIDIIKSTKIPSELKSQDANAEKFVFRSAIPRDDKFWKCKYCGENNPNTANSCLVCGNRKIGHNVNSFDNQTISENNKPSANEWKCSKCGKINQNYVGTCGCGQSKSNN